MKSREAIRTDGPNSQPHYRNLYHLLYLFSFSIHDHRVKLNREEGERTYIHENEEDGKLGF